MRSVACAAAAVALACCGRGGNGSAVPAGADAGSPHPGGETLWLATLGDATSVRGVAAVGDAAAVTATRGAGDALVVAAVDPSGEVSWMDVFSGSCALDGVPLGALDGALVVLARASCPTVVDGLGPDPVGPDGALLLLDDGGRLARRVAFAAPIMAAAADGAGHVAIVTGEAPPALEQIGADGAVAWRAGVAAATAVAAAPGGGWVVRVASDPARLVRVDPGGATAWARDLPAGLSVEGMAVLTDGAVAVIGSAAAPLAWGRGAAPAGGLALVAVEPDGSPRTAAGAGGAATPGAAALAPLPHGRVLVVSRESGCATLEALSPQLEPVWRRGVDAGCGTAAAGAVTTAGEQVVIAGTFRGRGDFGGGRSAVSADPSDAYALGLSP